MSSDTGTSKTDFVLLHGHSAKSFRSKAREQSSGNKKSQYEQTAYLGQSGDRVGSTSAQSSHAFTPPWRFFLQRVYFLFPKTYPLAIQQYIISSFDSKAEKDSLVWFLNPKGGSRKTQTRGNISLNSCFSVGLYKLILCLKGLFLKVPQTNSVFHISVWMHIKWITFPQSDKVHPFTFFSLLICLWKWLNMINEFNFIPSVLC